MEIKEKDPGIGGLKIWIMYVREFGEFTLIMAVTRTGRFKRGWNKVGLPTPELK